MAKGYFTVGSLQAYVDVLNGQLEDEKCPYRLVIQSFNFTHWLYYCTREAFATPGKWSLYLLDCGVPIFLREVANIWACKEIDKVREIEIEIEIEGKGTQEDDSITDD